MLSNEMTIYVNVLWYFMSSRIICKMDGWNTVTVNRSSCNINFHVS